ncbi:hypothetical protein CAOG_03799 [Capsaspora owczarzaki ATCC 30864]|uniref:Uncharacterized protein n=1 Tax=Capsaspora owczarzaki (strain ATCC 30864) TaxID=595528 RepID=A0A0D2VQH6_CAPO3|nr:hypothetical protein CAOG_03799 [Capsaspora owczarzaki ATCC 30864]KJE92917.1 hypothetical protein CAOG_003799 [Capsaspora owczarzaki ATCC 30864]|eukprot:XP_004363527.2 hypothetical protein CAOG_03799 [Capsaspora owczarzaki ATCC 30864]
MSTDRTEDVRLESLQGLLELAKQPNPSTNPSSASPNAPAGAATYSQAPSLPEMCNKPFGVDDPTDGDNHWESDPLCFATSTVAGLNAVDPARSRVDRAKQIDVCLAELVELPEKLLTATTRESIQFMLWEAVRAALLLQNGGLSRISSSSRQPLADALFEFLTVGVMSYPPAPTLRALCAELLRAMSFQVPALQRLDAQEDLTYAYLQATEQREIGSLKQLLESLHFDIPSRQVKVHPAFDGGKDPLA